MVEVTSTMRALARVTLTSYDCMVSDLDALVVPLGFQGSTSGATLAAVVRLMRAALNPAVCGSDAPMTLLVALEGGNVNPWWGAVAFIAELSGVGEMALMALMAPPSLVRGRTPVDALLATCRATHVAASKHPTWNVVVTDAATSPNGPPDTASDVAVLLTNTTDDAVVAAWAASAATVWFHRFNSMVVVGVRARVPI